MAYEPTTWKSGDVVTSAKLNKIEAGIASGGVLVVTDTEGTLDKTWQEIHDASFTVIRNATSDTNYSLFILIEVHVYNGEYYVGSVSVDDGDQFINYKAESANGYPVVVQLLPIGE